MKKTLNINNNFDCFDSFRKKITITSLLLPFESVIANKTIVKFI